MSVQHPIIAVTGSSGSGTSTVKVAFEHIFRREKVNAAIIEGDSFHRHNRSEMQAAIASAHAAGRDLSHFGAEGNCFDKLDRLFRDYAEHGTGLHRRYLHTYEEAIAHPGLVPGEFTPWAPLPPGTDLLFYEGLHGGVVTPEHNIAQHPDLLVGVVPIVNLEWIQKIHRDQARGYSPEAVVDTILRRMPDYVHYITPQFSRTDINFQRVPTVDTSNPFIARDIPTADESYVVIRFRDPNKAGIDFQDALAMIKDSFMSRRNTIVVPGGKMGMAMEIILTPIVHQLMARRPREF